MLLHRFIILYDEDVEKSGGAPSSHLLLTFTLLKALNAFYLHGESSTTVIVARANKMRQFINVEAVPSHPAKESPSSKDSNEGEKGRLHGLKEFSTNVSPLGDKRSANSMVDVHDVHASASEGTHAGNNENATASSKSRARNLRRKRAMQRRKQSDASSNGNGADPHRDEAETKKVDPPSSAVVVGTKPITDTKDISTGETGKNKKARSGRKRKNKTKTDLEQKPELPVASNSTVQVETKVAPLQALSLSSVTPLENADRREENPVPAILSSVVVKEEPRDIIVPQPKVEVIEHPKVELIEPPKVELTESTKVEVPTPVTAPVAKPTDLNAAYQDDNKSAAEAGKEDCACNACVIT